MSEATSGGGSTGTTTIPVTTEVRNELFSLKEPTDSYDDVLRRELDI
jgi:predicted CopG family antitoxin